MTFKWIGLKIMSMIWSKFLNLDKEKVSRWIAKHRSYHLDNINVIIMLHHSYDPASKSIENSETISYCTSSSPGSGVGDVLGKMTLHNYIPIFGICLHCEVRILLRKKNCEHFCNTCFQFLSCMPRTLWQWYMIVQNDLFSMYECIPRTFDSD